MTDVIAGAAEVPSVYSMPDVCSKTLGGKESWMFSTVHFFFSDRQPYRSDLQSGWCHKTSRPLQFSGLLPSPTAWSPDQHPAAMLADDSRHILGRTEGRGLGFGQLVRTHTGKCLKCQSSSDKQSDHMLCAQAEDSTNKLLRRHANSWLF